MKPPRARPLLFAAILMIAAPACARAEPVSVYTDFDVEKGCVQVESNEVGGTWNCPGYGGYPVILSESDLRESVFYGHAGPFYAKTPWQSFGPFNNAAGRIEWRLDKAGGVPFAAIQRWFTDTGDGGPKGQVLVVSKVGQPGIGEACVAGYVDALANKDANAIAQKVADETVRGFTCGATEPQWHGVKGPNAPEPFYGYGEDSDPGTEEPAQQQSPKQ